jgi:hypothetical protein
VPEHRLDTRCSPGCSLILARTAVVSPTVLGVTRLTVIVPCYNVEAYIAQTLRSLRASAQPGVEFVLVDDASTDSTAAVLAAEADRLPGARVVELPRNRGLAAARNAGIDAARGEYLTFLDGDDFVAAGYYPRLLTTIERLGCSMVRTDHVQVRGRERSVRRISHGPRGVVGRPRDAILPVDRPTSVDAPHAWAGIYHRRLVDSGLLYFSEHLRTCEDRPWNWRLHLRVDSFAVVGLLGVFYRRGIVTSLTQVTDERQLDFVAAFEEIVTDTRNDRDGELLMPKAVRAFCAVIVHHLNQLDRYEPGLAAELRRRCRRALLDLPSEPLQQVRSGLDASRLATLDSLGVAA